MEECPVCLEPLAGTVVLLGCCRKQVHIQCYVPTCPMCRATLPVPAHAVNQVIVPVPVAFVQPPIPKWKIILANLMGVLGIGGLVAWVVSPNFK